MIMHILNYAQVWPSLDKSGDFVIEKMLTVSLGNGKHNIFANIAA